MGSESKRNTFPIEIRRLDGEEEAEIFKHFNGGYMKYFIRVGPQGYFYSDPFESLIPRIYNLELRPDDIFVVTFPKAGTTWTQELVWLLCNGFDYDTAKTVPLVARFPFLEYSIFAQNDIAKTLIRKACEEDESKVELAKKLLTDGPDLVDKMPSPRFIKSHQPLSLLSPKILEKTKVIYVARDPRDIVVSYYHHYKYLKIYNYLGEFKDFWELVKNDLVEWAPILQHFREAWELRDHPNMLFLFYEELSKDLPDTIRRVAKFLGKTVTEEQIPALCEHLKFDNFKQNKAVNFDVLKQFGILEKDKHFVRKGIVGGWRDHFDEEMAKEAEQWIEEGLKGIDFKFKF